ALSEPGDLVVDPFASTDMVARAALQAGRRAIAVESSPRWAWLARTMAARPPAQQIDAALARLGDTLKDDAPLRVHIKALYATTCEACRESTAADYFVHARGSGPIARHYTCVHCGVTRDDPATEEDVKRSESYGARGMHYHLAFERVAPAGSLHAERLRKMLAVYTPRNLYALVTLTLKIDSLFYSDPERDVLRLLLLHLLDRGTSFYSDAAPDTTAQLTAHKQFVEFNLWHEIESAARQLAGAAPAIELAESPRGAIESAAPTAFVGAKSANSLAAYANTTALVVTALPSRRTAIWALSYLWGAWVLGKETAQPLIPFLDAKKDAAWERRWYFDSLVRSLHAVARALRPGGHIAFAFGESWHPIVEAVLLAAAGARFELKGFLFQPRQGETPRREFDDLRGEYRITCMFAPGEDTNGSEERVEAVEAKIRAASLAGASDVLRRRGEPLAYSWVHHAAYVRAMREGLLSQAAKLKGKTPPGRLVHNAVVAGLSEGYAHDFDHYTSPGQFLWLRRSTEIDPPLVERVESEVRQKIETRGTVSRDELEDEIYATFPGDLTPEAGLIDLCARTYADEQDGVWRRREEDFVKAKARALDLIAELGTRLDYAIVRGEDPFDLAWQTGGETVHGFVWRDQTRIGDVAGTRTEPARGYLVVPESRVALLREKVRRLPQSADALRAAGWDFVRIPPVEQVLAADKLEPNALALAVGLVPPVSEERAQLEMF
ncbi:MAG: site-specific DNA-methyltransferase, partial [Chloroflexi bacterium]|nr:site-specific DNA-methyltransferase [Chloroflexota bacterium]